MATKKQRSTGAVEEQFNFEINENELEAYKKGEYLANTVKCTNWAIKNFEMWLIAHNARFLND